MFTDPELTVKLTPLLATPPAAVTTTLPVVAPEGTAAAMLVFVHELTVAAVPLNVTPPLPWLDPKLVPVMVTEVPTDPEVGDRLLIFGAGTTVKLTPLLATLFTLTTRLPVVAPEGTMAVTLVFDHEFTVVAVVPLKVTVLVP